MLNKDNYLEELKKSRGEQFTFLEPYIKSTTAIKCKCNVCNNIWKVAPYELIIRKSNCPICSKNNVKENLFLSLEELNNRQIEEYGYVPYIYLSEYKGVHENIKVQCKKCGEVFYIKPNNIFNKIRDHKPPTCKNCSKEKMKEDFINTLENKENNYKEKLEKKFNGNIILIDKYKGSSVPIKHKCMICNYEWLVRPSNILSKKDKKCPNCNKLVKSDKTYEERLADLHPNIINLEPYKFRRTKIKHQCLVCNHVWEAVPNNVLKKNYGCPKCHHIFSESKNELELLNFIKKNYSGTIIHKDHSLLKRQEIDIYLPDLKLAFEIDGLYWHSDKFKDKNYHLNKTKECEKLGVQLIHIFENEFKDHKEILYSKIKHLLKLDYDLPVVYARNCYIEEINNNDKKEFLNSNHIQGNDSSQIKLGLWYPQEDGDMLVSVMTFSKPRKCMNNKNNKEIYDYELVRFANEHTVRVLGSFGKLLKYFLNNYKVKTIITYADRRWSIGTIYKNNNFIFDHESEPSYWYYNNSNKKLYHRYNFRKQNLKKKFPEVYDESLTESEIMKKLKYRKIYDCGNLVYIYQT